MAFETSPLSSENVLRDVHDPASQRLRVDVQTSMTPGAVEVVIDQADDSIRIGDGTNLVTATQVDGKTGLDVNVISPVSTVDASVVLSVYGEVSSVAAATPTNIISRTLAQDERLQMITVSGGNVAEFTVLVDGNVVDKKRTYFTEYNQDFVFGDGLSLSAGQVIVVRVVHSRPEVADFNARIQVGREPV